MRRNKVYCIYRITNKLNGKTYIGQHKYKKLNDNYMGSGIHIKRAIKKYGKENFAKEILYSRIQYKETADDMERFAIAKERVLGKAEYNITPGGQGGALHKGMHHSEKTKKKISEAMKGKNNPRYGKPAWNRGKHLSEETKRKLSEAKKGKNKGRPSPRKGTHLSEETKRKMSESWKGKRKGTHWKLVDGKHVYY